MVVDPETVEMLKNAATGSAALVAAYVGLAGLKTWRRKLTGVTEHELARRLLKHTLKVRDRIQEVRRPSMWAGEIRSALEDAGYDDDGDERPEEWRREQAVYNRRLSRLQDAMSDLYLERLEAETLWGSDASDTFDPLHECIAELRATVWLHIRMVRGGHHVDPTSDQQERRDEVLYRISDDPEEDPFSEELERAVTKVEDRFRGYLRT